MKNQVIDTNEIRNNVNSILNSYDESDLYEFALFHAMRNYKDGKKSHGDPCTPKYSLMYDEWEFCELWRVGGMAWINEVDESVFTEWYEGSVAERICVSAYRVASFYAVPGFFDVEEDNETRYLKDLHRDLCRWESIVLAKEYWVQGEFYLNIEESQPEQTQPEQSEQSEQVTGQKPPVIEETTDKVKIKEWIENGGNCRYQYGFTFKGAKSRPISKEDALAKLPHFHFGIGYYELYWRPENGVQTLIFNEYSEGDML